MVRSSTRSPGGEALLVLDIGYVKALAVFKEPATGALRLACGSEDKKVRVFDAVSGGRCACWSLCSSWRSNVQALVAFKDLATGRAAARERVMKTEKVRVFDPVAGGEALVVLEGHTRRGVYALTAFTDPATGEQRLVSGSDDNTSRVWNPAASGAAIEAEPEGHSDDVSALVTFVDPATGTLRVATGSDDGTIRVWDAETGGALLVIDVGSMCECAGVLCGPGDGRAAARLRNIRWRRDGDSGDVRSSTRSRAARRCSCSTWALYCELVGILRGPGDGRRGGLRLW